MCHNKRESVNISSLLLPSFFVPLPALCSFQIAFTYLFLYAVQLQCIPTKVSTVNSRPTPPRKPPTDPTAQKTSGLQMCSEGLTTRADGFTLCSSPLLCRRPRRCSTCWPGVWSRRRPLLGSRPLQTPPQGPPGSRRWVSAQRKRDAYLASKHHFSSLNERGDVRWKHTFHGVVLMKRIEWEVWCCQALQGRLLFASFHPCWLGFKVCQIFKAMQWMREPFPDQKHPEGETRNNTVVWNLRISASVTSFWYNRSDGPYSQKSRKRTLNVQLYSEITSVPVSSCSGNNGLITIFVGRFNQNLAFGVPSKDKLSCSNT